MTRRTFSLQIATTLAASFGLSGQTTPARRLKIGHTGITWGNESEQAIKDISALGYYGFETFGEVLEDWDKRGGLRELLDAHHLPLISGYCTFNMVDPAKRKDELAKMALLGWPDQEERAAASAVLGAKRCAAEPATISLQTRLPSSLA